MTAIAVRPPVVDTPVMRVATRRLASRMEQLIRELHLWRRTYGRWPTIRHLRNVLGYASISTVSYQLDKAVTGGLVTAPEGGYMHRQYRPNYSRLVFITEGGVMKVYERLP